MSYLNNFSAATVNPSTGQSQLYPAGDYVVIIDRTNVGPTKDGNNGAITVNGKIQGGQFNGGSTFKQFNCWFTTGKDPAMTSRLAHEELAALMYCIGVPVINDQPVPDNAIPLLHGKPCIWELSVTPILNDKGEVTGQRNNVVKFKDLQGRDAVQVKNGAAGPSSAQGGPPPAQGGFPQQGPGQVQGGFPAPGGPGGAPPPGGGFGAAAANNPQPGPAPAAGAWPQGGGAAPSGPQNGGGGGAWPQGGGNAQQQPQQGNTAPAAGAWPQQTQGGQPQQQSPPQNSGGAWPQQQQQPPQTGGGGWPGNSGPQQPFGR